MKIYVGATDKVYFCLEVLGGLPVKATPHGVVENVRFETAEPVSCSCIPFTNRRLPSSISNLWLSFRIAHNSLSTSYDMSKATCYLLIHSIGLP